MEIHIIQNCPSCGASITLQEDERVIRCSYCDMHIYKVGSVADRFALPSRLPDTVSRKQLIYAPYLRFKGSIFYVKGNDVRYKIVDTTRTGLKDHAMPVSLGLRPQAMSLYPVVSGTEGAFIPQTVPTKAVFIHASMVADIFEERSNVPIYHRSFIGDTLSRIYQPYYISGELLVDAVDNRPVGSAAAIKPHLQKTCGAKVSWEPQFLSTSCPQCGGMLSGEKDSIVLHCKNCESLWQEENKRFVPVPWLVVDSDDHAAKYLPFWQIRLRTQGYTLKSFGDYLRFTNQPVVAAEKFDTQPMILWFPAFKLNPKAFLQIAAQLTISQGRLPPGKTRRIDNAHPVTLNHKEALQSTKAVLAGTTLCREKSFPLLPKIQIAESHADLTFLPFIEQTHDLIQEHTAATVQSGALRFGRSL